MGTISWTEEALDCMLLAQGYIREGIPSEDVSLQMHYIENMLNNASFWARKLSQNNKAAAFELIADVKHEYVAVFHRYLSDVEIRYLLGLPLFRG